MDESTKSEKEYDLGDVPELFTMESTAGTKNISLVIHTDTESGNASLKNLVRENCTQGSVRGDVVNGAPRSS